MIPSVPIVTTVALSPKSARQSRQRFNYTDKAKVLQWMQVHSASFTETCNRFGLAESTLRKWSIRKSSILIMANTMKGSSKSIHKSTVPALEATVMEWIQERGTNKSEGGITRFTVKQLLAQGRDQLLTSTDMTMDSEQRTALEKLKFSPHFVHKFMSRHDLLDNVCSIKDDDISSHLLTDHPTLPEEFISSSSPPPPKVAPSIWDQRILYIEQQWGVSEPVGNRKQRIEYLEKLVFGKSFESKTLAERLLALE